MRLGDLLIEAGLITREQLAAALGHQQLHGGRLGTNLVELGMVTEVALSSILSKHMHLPAVTAAAVDKVPKAVITLLPPDLAERHRACPIRLDGTRLWVAISDPTDQKAIAEIAAATRCEVRPMVAPDTLIGYALEKHYALSRMRRFVSVTSQPHLELQLDRTTVSSPPVFPDLYAPQAAGGAPTRQTSELIIPPSFATPRPESLDEAPLAARFDLAELAQRLARGTSEAELADAALAFIGQDFARVAALTLRGGVLVGWRGHGAGMNYQALRAFSSPAQAIPVVAKSLADGRHRFGVGTPTTLGPLTDALGPPGERAMLVLPIRCGAEAIGALAAVGGRDGVEAWLGDYQAAAAKLDLALQMLVLRKKLLAT